DAAPPLRLKPRRQTAATAPARVEKTLRKVEKPAISKTSRTGSRSDARASLPVRCREALGRDEQDSKPRAAHVVEAGEDEDGPALAGVDQPSTACSRLPELAASTAARAENHHTARGSPYALPSESLLHRQDVPIPVASISELVDDGAHEMEAEPPD